MIARQLLRRLGQLVPVLAFVSFITFMMLNLLPGDTALAILGQNATPQSLAQLRAQLHLNEPLPQRYIHWIGGVLSGHLGSSMITKVPVATVLAQRLPVTAELIGLSIFLAVCVAIPVATLAAYRAGGWFDGVSRAVSMGGISVPAFILGIVLIFLFSVKLHLLPATGFVPLGKSVGGNLRRMILPAVTLSIVLAASYLRILRGDIVEQLQNEDYVLTARAKGVSESRVLFGHVLRNSLFGLITIIGVNLGTLIGASVIVESLFALPGIGQELILAINQRDATEVEGIVLVTAVVVVIANSLADVLYAVVDPRVRHAQN